MPSRSNNTPLLAVFVVFLASMVGMGVFVAWLLRQMDTTARLGASSALKQATEGVERAYERASDAANKAVETALAAAHGAMPVDRVQVGDTPDPEQAWEGTLPWYLQGQGYDPTDDRIPDPVSLAHSDRTVMIPAGVDLLEHVKTQPTPHNFGVAFPNLAGEDMDGL